MGLLPSFPCNWKGLSKLNVLVPVFNDFPKTLARLPRLEVHHGALFVLDMFVFATGVAARPRLRSANICLATESALVLGIEFLDFFS